MPPKILSMCNRMKLVIAILFFIIAIAFSWQNEVFNILFVLGSIFVLLDEWKLFGKNFILSPLLLFTTSYLYVYFSGSIQITPSDETRFLYGSSYLGFLIGWKYIKYRLNILKIKLPLRRLDIRIGLISLFILSYISLYHIPTTSYLILILLHLVSSLHLIREKKIIPSISNILITLFFSFLLGKIVVLRYLIILLFIYSEKGKLNVKKVIAYSIGSLAIFIVFNLRRYSIEGNTEYINLSLLQIIEPKNLLRLLTAGSDYIRTTNILVSSDINNLYQFGKTYISGILKFLPRELFIIRPPSGNAIVNAILNENYIYNSNTTASTFVGELYINFGYLSIIGAFLIGSTQKIIWNSFLNLSTKYSFLYLSFLYAMQFSLVRDDFNIAFGTFLMYTIGLSTIITYKNKNE